MSSRLRVFVVQGLVLVSIILGLLLIGVPQRGALAEKLFSSTNPFVVIAVDATSPKCIEILRTNKPHPSITITHCPEGTVIESEQIYLSQALAEHKHYVLLPSKKISPAATKQLISQIQQLMKQEGKQLAATSKKEKHPEIPCGSSGWAAVYNWSPTYYGNLNSEEQYYKTSDCQYVDLEVASIYVGAVPKPGPWYWNVDLYAGYYFNVPGDPALSKVGGSYHHSVDQLFSPGYYYETWIYTNVCCYNSAYVNIGPIQ